MTRAFAIGEAVAGFAVGLWRAVRVAIVKRRADRTPQPQPAWVERSRDAWVIRRADGAQWTGNAWQSFGLAYPTRDAADAVLQCLTADGSVIPLKG